MAARKSKKKNAPTLAETAVKRFKRGLDRIDQLLVDGEEFLHDKHVEAMRADGLKSLTLFMLARAAMALRSVKKLTISGHDTDATSVLRTLAELLIDLKYLRTDAANLVKLYTEYTDVANYRRYTQLAKFPIFVSKTPPALIAKLKRKHDKVIANYPKPTQWTPKSLEERAKLGQGAIMYELAYRMGCSATHSGPGTLQDNFSDKLGRLTGTPQPVESGFVLFNAAWAFLWILTEAREVFGDDVSYWEAEMNTLPTLFSKAGVDKSEE